MSKLIDTDHFAEQLRSKGLILEERKILITNFLDSKQESDLSLPANCNGFGRIHHFKRTSGPHFPENPLPIDPAFNYLGSELRNQAQVQVFQNAICSWRCWYCFVDYALLSGNPKRGAFKTASQLIDLYLEVENRPHIIDISGGQPDLVPEWAFWMLEELEKRDLQKDVYVWTDDNLSNDYLWKYLSDDQVKQFASYRNFGKVGCFKGFDSKSFSFNTLAEPSLWYRQFDIMRRLIESGFDMYAYVTLTSADDFRVWDSVANFVDMLQEKVHPLFPLRTIPLQISKFSPTAERMSSVHEKAIFVQNEAVMAWNAEIEKRFSPTVRGRKIFEHKVNG